jgi:hypothetical protein
MTAPDLVVCYHADTHEFDTELSSMQDTLKAVVTDCVTTTNPALPFYQGLLKSVTDKRVALRVNASATAIQQEVLNGIPTLTKALPALSSGPVFYLTFHGTALPNNSVTQIGFDETAAFQCVANFDFSDSKFQHNLENEGAGLWAISLLYPALSVTNKVVDNANQLNINFVYDGAPIATYSFLKKSTPGLQIDLTTSDKTLILKSGESGNTLPGLTTIFGVSNPHAFQVEANFSLDDENLSFVLMNASDWDIVFAPATATVTIVNNQPINTNSPLLIFKYADVTIASYGFLAF